MPPPDFIPALDTLGMFQAALDSSSQFVGGADSASGVGAKLDKSRIQNIVVTGMGGSAITGDLIAAASKNSLEVPLFIVRSYELPAFAGENTLVLAVSFSGRTKETLSTFDSALSRGSQIAVISTGGELMEKAAQHSLPVAKIDVTIPMPRAALMAIFSAALTILSEAGFISADKKTFDAVARHLKKRVGELAGEDSPARKLAGDIKGTLPLIRGAEGIGAAAARRWKTQINENVKTPAFYSELPEACHNELVGWGLHGDITRQVFSLIQLRNDYESPDVAAAFPVTAEMEKEVVSECYEIKAKGDSIFAQILDLVLFGDFTTLFMADMAGVDSGPIPAIDEFKKLTSGL